MPPRAVTALDPNDVPEDVDPSAFENRPGVRFVMYRGTLYELNELETGEFDDIQKACTKQVPDPVTGQVNEVFDRIQQQRMLLNKMLVQGKPAGGISKLPPRVLFNLNSIVDQMTFGEEKDELEEARKKKAEANGEEPKGNS